MFRWSYIVPRVAIALLLFLAYWFGLNPLVRLALIISGENLLHAKTEIGRVDASLVHANARLRNVCLADPLAPMKNLFQAQEVAVSLETGPLLRRRFIVDEAQITGLQLGTDRQTAGAVNPDLLALVLPGERELQFARQEASAAAQALLSRFAALLQQNIQQQIDELQTPRLAKELLQRWPRRFQELSGRADALKQRANVLKQSLDNRPGSTPADLERYRKLTAEMQAIPRDVQQLRGDLDQLLRQAAQDQQALGTACQHDLQDLKDKFNFDNFNAEQLSGYLLGPDLSNRLETLAQWINWGRRHLLRQTAAGPPRRQGIDISSFGLPPGPDFLVRQMIVDGQTPPGPDRVLFRAWLTGLTSQPERYDQPLVVRVEMSAPSAVHINAVFDRRTATPHDRLVVQCPGLPQPRRTLGKPEQLALVVSPGNLQVAVLLDLQGEQISGQLVLRQAPVDLIPQLDDKCGGSRVAAILQQSLSKIRSIEAVVDLSGTLQQPQWKFRSNLGPKLAEGVNGMLQSQLRSHRDELAAALQSRVADGQSHLKQLLATQQQGVLAKLSFDVGSAQGVAQSIISQLPPAQQAAVRDLQSKLPDLQKKLPIRF